MAPGPRSKRQVSRSGRASKKLTKMADVNSSKVSETHCQQKTEETQQSCKKIKVEQTMEDDTCRSWVFCTDDNEIKVKHEPLEVEDQADSSDSSHDGRVTGEEDRKDPLFIDTDSTNVTSETSDCNQIVQTRSGNCRPSTGGLHIDNGWEANSHFEEVKKSKRSSSYKTSAHMDHPGTSNGLQGKFLRRCPNCTQCVHVRSNVCKFCKCDFRNSRELMKKEEEARFLLKGKKALERNTASRVLRRIENQLTYLRGCGYEALVIYYKKGPARVTHGILPKNALLEEDKDIFSTNFFLSRTRKLDEDKFTLGSEGAGHNALEKIKDELQEEQLQEVQQAKKVAQVKQERPLAVIEKQQELHVVKLEPHATTPEKQKLSKNVLGFLGYLKRKEK
ncbi:uncharacterized protein [Procambarus clarkii]|uniref:uncharacterized protein n=1 Tax=Procambarus clarkii TaxID=6728 RepID=UPI003743E60E